MLLGVATLEKRCRYLLPSTLSLTTNSGGLRAALETIGALTGVSLVSCLFWSSGKQYHSPVTRTKPRFVNSAF